MSSSPAVSVLLPVLNGASVVAESLESILGQTLDDIEVVVIDDGSTDATCDVLRKFTDPRVKVVENRSRVGVAASLNRGLSLARASLIARQDADDWSFPDRLEKQWAFMNAHRPVGVLGTAVIVEDTAASAAFSWSPPRENHMICWSQLFSSAIAHPSVMFRRDAVVGVGGYPDVETEDLALWHRLAGTVEFANLSDELVIYRRHPQSKTVADPATHWADTLSVLRPSWRALVGHDYRGLDSLMVALCSTGRVRPVSPTAAAEVLGALVAGYVSEARPSEAMRKAIRLDAAQRLLDLASRSEQLRAATLFSYAAHAAAMSPRVAAERRTWSRLRTCGASLCSR